VTALRYAVHSIKIIGLAKLSAGEARGTLTTSAGFNMIVSKHEGLAKLADAINALLPAAEPFNS
jgi:hypothetical protein